MIGKAPGTGTGFRGVVNYLLLGKRNEENPARVAWTETRNLLVGDPDRAPSMMRATAEQSQRCKKPVYHFVISWRQDEYPSADLMRLIGDATLADLGLSDHQALLIAHNDTDHRHLHVVVNRVHPETAKAWHTGKDWERLETSLGRQAVEHGLLFVPGRFNTKEPERRSRNVTDGEYQQARKEHKPVPPGKWSPEAIKRWRTELGPHFDGARSWDQLADRLGAYGLTLERKGQGLIIGDQTGHMKLSDLGKEVRLPKLQALYGQSFAEYAEHRAKPDPRPNDAIVIAASALQHELEADAPDAAMAESTAGKPQRPHLRRQRSERQPQFNADKKNTEDDNDNDPVTQALKEKEEEERKNLRDQQRQQRLAMREKALQTNTAERKLWNTDDNSNSEQAMSFTPEPSQSNAGPHSAQADLNDKVSEAYASHDFAKALHTLGFIDDNALQASREEIARVVDELEQTQSFHEYIESSVADALTSFAQNTNHTADNQPASDEDELEREDDRER